MISRNKLERLYPKTFRLLAEIADDNDLRMQKRFQLDDVYWHFIEIEQWLATLTEEDFMAFATGEWDHEKPLQLLHEDFTNSFAEAAFNGVLFDDIYEIRRAEYR